MFYSFSKLAVLSVELRGKKSMARICYNKTTTGAARAQGCPLNTTMLWENAATTVPFPFTCNTNLLTTAGATISFSCV